MFRQKSASHNSQNWHNLKSHRWSKSICIASFVKLPKSATYLCFHVYYFSTLFQYISFTYEARMRSEKHQKIQTCSAKLKRPSPPRSNGQTQQHITSHSHHSSITNNQCNDDHPVRQLPRPPPINPPPPPPPLFRPSPSPASSCRSSRSTTSSRRGRTLPKFGRGRQRPEIKRRPLPAPLRPSSPPPPASRTRKTSSSTPHPPPIFVRTAGVEPPCRSGGRSAAVGTNGPLQMRGRPLPTSLLPPSPAPSASTTSNKTSSVHCLQPPSTSNRSPNDREEPP